MFNDIYEFLMILRHFSPELLAILAVVIAVWLHSSKEIIIALCVFAVSLLIIFHIVAPIVEKKVVNTDILQIDGDLAQITSKYKSALEMIDCFFYDGSDEEQYFSRAENLLRQLSKQGYSEAQFYLGYMLDPRHVKIKEKYNSITQNAQEAKETYHAAALQGHVMAQYYLANIYFDEKDYPHATEWYKIAADKGNIHAQYALGYMYGIGYAFGNIDTSSYKKDFDEGFKTGRAERK